MKKRAGLYTHCALWGWLTLGFAHGSAIAQTLKLEVRETAGIRRFGYPIAIKLPESISGATTGHFRLRDGDKPLPAQFRQEKNENDAGAWWLDFNVNMMPGEVRTFVLEYGPDVAEYAEPPGLELEELPDGFIIRNRKYISWNLGRDLRGLLQSVAAGELQHLRREGVSLAIAGPNEPYEIDAKAVHARVIRSGPLTIAIRYEFKPTSGPLAELKSAVDLTFPVSKSWVQVDWRIDDPRNRLDSIRATIAQNLDVPTEARPTLIDFGASSLVYMSLTQGMIGKLHANTVRPRSNGSPSQSWEVLRGTKDRLGPFVNRPAGSVSGDAEGWAHIMDRGRCLALAVDEFGDAGADSIETTAEGDLTLARKFASDEAGGLKVKRCRFWLHFVGFPPHLTAATSPQAMLSPLAVRVSEP